MDHHSSGCLPVGRFPTFASGRQDRGQVNPSDFRPQFRLTRLRDVAREESPAYGDSSCGNEIFDFKIAYDWRWRDPQDSSEWLTAFPGWQPWLYRSMLLVNYCAFGSAILLVVLPSARRRGKMISLEP
jgi:hypothetical protein